MSRRRWSKLNTTTTWKKRQRPEEWGGNFLMTVGWWITNDWHTEILISVSRPRWWYLIICNCYKGVFKYYITLLFFGGGDPPFSHLFTLVSHWDSTWESSMGKSLLFGILDVTSYLYWDLRIFVRRNPSTKFYYVEFLQELLVQTDILYFWTDVLSVSKKNKIPTCSAHS